MSSRHGGSGKSTGVDDPTAPGTVYVAEAGGVVHLDPDCWVLDGRDIEARDPTEAPGKTCEDCDLRRRIERALAAHRRDDR